MSTSGEAERRSHPRFAAHLRVRVREVEMFTANLSRAGAQLACAVTLATVIQRDLDAGRLRLELELPDATVCVIDAAVRYTAEVDDEVLIGIEHLAFGEGSRAPYLAYCEAGAARGRPA